MRKKFVNDLGWIEDEEMLDIIAISQSSPGAIAINTSLMIGYRIGGPLGAFVSLLGTIIPPFTIISIISLFYMLFRDNKFVSAVMKGMQAGVCAVIVDVVFTMGYGVVVKKQLFQILIMIGAFIASYIFKINVIYIILVSGLIGVIMNKINTINTINTKRGVDNK